MPSGQLAATEAIELARSARLFPIRAQGLSYVVNDLRIIDHVDLSIESAGVTAVMGFNGAGKSVLLRLLHGLLEPSSGQVTYAGQRLNPEIRAAQAMVFQKPLMLRRSVAANIRYALRIHGVAADIQQARLDELLSLADLTPLARRPARVLSGGEQQRVAIARALAGEPRLLYLDEPTANLDPVSIRSVEAMIDTVRQRGTKIVLVTQSVGQAKRIADEIVFIHRGRIVEQTSATEFFSGPEAPPAAAFVEGNPYV
jgi:tungstate transport system ATP-binding protein